jgi:hypothetical protein
MSGTVAVSAAMTGEHCREMREPRNNPKWMSSVPVRSKGRKLPRHTAWKPGDRPPVNQVATTPMPIQPPRRPFNQRGHGENVSLAP